MRVVRCTFGGHHRAGRSAWLIVPLAAIAVAVALPVSAVAATAPVSTLSVAPANPLGSKSIVVQWYADRAPRPGRDYRIEMRIDGEGALCRSFAEAVVTPTWKKGATVRATLRVNRATGRAWWCIGKAAVRVVARSGSSGTTLARTLFEVRDDPNSPTPSAPIGTRVRIDLLAGSAMTVKVPGRPDRSAPLSGTLRGFLPGKFKPNTNLTTDSIAGAITVTGMPPDPLCMSNGRPATTTFQVLDVSTMVLLASGTTYFTLAPAEELLGVAGCSGPPPNPPRAAALTARVGPAGLVNLPMSGTIGDVTLHDGTAASITLSLVVKIDLSGK